MTIDSTTKIFLGGVEQVKILKNGLVIWERDSSQPDYFYIENTYSGSNTITFTTTSTDPVTGTYADSIEYSKDKSAWTTLTFVPGTPQTVTLNQGEKLYLRNSSSQFNSNGYYTSIKGSQTHNVGGDIMTLVDYTSQNPNVPERCFYYLFFNNTGLVSASSATMPSTTNSFSFTYMFRGCTALTGAPTLPATTMVSNCYNAMFSGCTALTTAPALPATTLGGFCYRSMFNGCTSLTTPPALPATTLVSGCYRLMFNGCTSLTTAPVLPATTLASNCYYDMFNGCTSLNEVTTYANDISATDCITNWLSDVAASGTFYNNGTATYTVDSASGIPVGWTEVKPAPQIDYFYIENISVENILSVKTTGNSTGRAASVEWSKDKENWTTISLPNAGMTSTITMNPGDKVYFRNDSGVFNSTTKYIYFNCTQTYRTGGDLSTLTDYNNIGTTGAYCNLFKDDSELVDASQLTISGSISDRCFQNTFLNCTSLTTAPTLPATTLATYCYYGMFSGCTSLTTAPVLPATTLAASCYNNMFKGCTSLTSVPSNYLPATTLEQNCYYGMFSGCTSLTTAPTLPATTLAAGCCREMFSDCTALTTAPELPATTLSDNCYQYIFRRCTSLTTAPTLPATTLAASCYYAMFQDCTSLTTAPTLSATTLADSCCYNMFYGCTSLTSVPSNYLPATTLEIKCYCGMFRGCTSLTTAPTLPATTLATYCYQNMFNGCTSLTTAPTLPATTLATYCYNSMFYGCTSLKIGPDIKATATTSSSLVSMFNGCTSLYMITTNISTFISTHMASWVLNVSPTGYFFNLGGATFQTGNNGIPTGWTEHMFRIKDTVLTPATGTEYSVTANVEWSPSLTWTSADIIISDSDSGAGTRSATLTFTPGEVVNGVLTPANNIDINFQDPDTWFELIVYNNGTVVDTQYVSYTTL